ncbi:MAG: succinate semialdehyde dehydrogenase NADP+ linked [Phylliscum demangeonii]|nr:MAG: succinate semialdehyde dehydrogenase NADP+ linked [Phylliscum demangeonii]
MTTAELKDPSLFKKDCYVNGQWVQAASRRTFEVQDPASLAHIGSCPEFGAEDTERAIAAAATALPAFRRTTGRERSRMLRRWYQLMIDHADDLAKIITWENGKPLSEAKAEVSYAAGFFEWFSEEAPRTYGDTIPATIAGHRVLTVKQPVGVCGLITPWNFPAAMISRKIAPALAAGCTVVAKAPSETPLTALALAELAQRAGIPPGVVNVVTADDQTAAVGQTLTSSATVQKISFTGSTAVGQLLMRQSAGTLKKLSLELGGNAAFIVFEDADLTAAVGGALASKFRSSGQTCVCANRIYVQRAVYDAFCDRFTAAVQRDFRLGSGFALDTTHGPLIHADALRKVQQHVADARAHGARLLLGGQPRPDLGPTFFAPTVLADMHGAMQLAREETFGPVAAIFPFETEAQVVRLANETEVGLAAYLYARDLARVGRVAEALDVGMVGVNTGVISDVAAPFGGVKFSGFGREGSKYGIEEYQVVKTITMGGMDQPLLR